MAITTTPNIGLVKFDESELVNNFINGFEWYEDNNLQIADKCDVNLTLYVPTITAQTTPPNVGAGARKGEYIDYQGIVIGQFSFDFTDPGVAAGSGEYAISLPFTVDNSFHSVGTAFNAAPGPYSVVGECYIYDSSALATSGGCALDVVTVAGTSYVRIITEVFTAPAKTSRFLTNAQPFTIATGDCINGNFIFKKS